MEIVSLAERPDLVPAMWQLPNDWPAFMMNEPNVWVHHGLRQR